MREHESTGTDRRKSATRPPRARPTSADAVRALNATAGNAAVARAVEKRRRHESGCSCAACSGTAARPTTATLQRYCVYCRDHFCFNGSKCGRDPSFGGVFDPDLETRTVDAHRYTKKDSKRGQFESEHMLPSAAWKRSGIGHSYQDLPTMSIPYKTHRGGQSGAGGGVSSTGFSHTAQGWSRSLGDLMAQGNMYEAVRRASVDAYNSAEMTGALDQAYVSQIMQVIALHAERGDITDVEAGQINNALLNRFYGRR